MKNIISHARNIVHQQLVADKDGNKKLVTSVEAIFTLCEKNYRFVGQGLAAIEDTETVRFFLSPEGCLEMAECLKGWAEDAKEEHNQLLSGDIGE